MFHIGVKKSDDKEEKFREVSTYLTISEQGLTTKAGVNLNLYILLTFFANAMGVVITELDENDPLGDLEKKMKTCIGKKFRGVVSHEKGLNKDYNKVLINTRLEMKRCRSLNDTTLSEATINGKDFVSELTPKDRAILNGTIIPDEYKKTNKPSGVDDAFGIPPVNDGPDGENLAKLPF